MIRTAPKTNAYKDRAEDMENESGPMCEKKGTEETGTSWEWALPPKGQLLTNANLCDAIFKFFK